MQYSDGTSTEPSSTVLHNQASPMMLNSDEA
jgi:hypothetical protein